MIVIDSTKWLSFLFLYQSKDNGLQKYSNFFINTGTRFLFYATNPTINDLSSNHSLL